MSLPCFTTKQSSSTASGAFGNDYRKQWLYFSLLSPLSICFSPITHMQSSTSAHFSPLFFKDITHTEELNREWWKSSVQERTLHGVICNLFSKNRSGEDVKGLSQRWTRLKPCTYSVFFPTHFLLHHFAQTLPSKSNSRGNRKSQLHFFSLFHWEQKHRKDRIWGIPSWGIWREASPASPEHPLVELVSKLSIRILGVIAYLLFQQ